MDGSPAADLSACVTTPLLFIAGVLVSRRLAGDDGWFIRRRALNLSPSRDSPLEALGRSNRPIILFDGYCGLCSFWVDFVLRHDRQHRYLFTPLQSPAGKALLEAAGLSTDVVDSVTLYDAGFIYQRSSAILRVLSGLRGAWSTARLLVAVPVPLRDFVYDMVARHRYGWFGRSDSCRVPTSEERARFI